MEAVTAGRMIDKVGEVIKSINEAKHVDQVICNLHSVAVLLFPLDSHAFSGSIDEKYSDEVNGAEVPTELERDKWWQVFYQGAAFPTLARFLLHDVALDWLGCFPISAKKHVYDVFFLRGRVTEVVQTLVPCLQSNGNGRLDDTVCANVERLLVLCLLENDGVLRLATEFAQSGSFNEKSTPAISRVAQLVTSIPDKARLGASTALSSHFFFKEVTTQLIKGAEELNSNIFDATIVFSESDMDGTILFVGEVFARTCRRGSADVLLSELVPPILTHVRAFILPVTDSINESKPDLQFWSKIMNAIKDPYALERISEQLLHQLAAQNASDVEAYWTLWILYHQIYEHQASVRSMFVEKFLLWKVFPICCLRWILQFAVLECVPDTSSKTESKKGRGLLDTAERVLAVWSKREFVQSASIEQQAYVTAAVGLSLEKMVKEDLDASKDAMHSILQGVSCRLESPSNLVRKMGSCVALVFSQIIDPSNPLYLDDCCNEETIDWEFGLTTPVRGILVASEGTDKDIKVEGHSTFISEKESNSEKTDQIGIKNANKKLVEFKLLDPDEVIDPAALNNELVSDEDNDDDEASQTSETSSDSSLQPYDLHDDDSDLKKNLSQLVDVVAALRKSDDADGVERALDVAEKLIRASPDELKFVAADLVRTLVQVRCSDSTVEGEEEPAEEKRQKALIALIITCPFDSLDSMNKLLYSPNVDVSQRIMILDVMTNAAQEFANTRTRKEKRYSTRAHISITSETQPWFMPSSMGPPEAGMWKEISGTESPLSYSYSYERDLPANSSQINRGKSRRWASRPSGLQDSQLEWSQNKFPQYAAAFMLPAMQGFDKKRHGVDLLGRDFIVLGKLIYMLGMCMKCAAMHPEASVLALPLMDMLSSRVISYHEEAYVRKSALFAASCILVALHPSFVASSLVEGNLEVSRGLEWVRTWALAVTESDTDKECYTMAMACLQLHSEMAFQTSRVLESSENKFQTSNFSLPWNLLKGSIKIPYLNP